MSSSSSSHRVTSHVTSHVTKYAPNRLRAWQMNPCFIQQVVIRRLGTEHINLSGTVPNRIKSHLRFESLLDYSHQAMMAMTLIHHSYFIFVFPPSSASSPSSPRVAPHRTPRSTSRLVLQILQNVALQHRSAHHHIRHNITHNYPNITSRILLKIY